MSPMGAVHLYHGPAHGGFQAAVLDDCTAVEITEPGYPGSSVTFHFEKPDHLLAWVLDLKAHVLDARCQDGIESTTSDHLAGLGRDGRCAYQCVGPDLTERRCALVEEHEGAHIPSIYPTGPDDAPLLTPDQIETIAAQVRDALGLNSEPVVIDGTPIRCPNLPADVDPATLGSTHHHGCNRCGGTGVVFVEANLDPILDAERMAAPIKVTRPDFYRSLGFTPFPVPAATVTWRTAPTCNASHPFGEDGWRPGRDEAHEHLVLDETGERVFYEWQARAAGECTIRHEPSEMGHEWRLPSDLKDRPLGRGWQPGDPHEHRVPVVHRVL